MRATAGAVVMLVLATACAVLWFPTAPSLWRRGFAQPCPAGAASSDCVATLPAVVFSTFFDRAEARTWLALTVEGAPPDTPMAFGYVNTSLTPRDAERLGITGDNELVKIIGNDDQVKVTLFDASVVAVTGPNGESAETKGWVFYTLVDQLAASAAAISAVALAGILWQQVGWGRHRWVARATVSAMIGVFAGALAGGVAGRWAADTTVIPTMFAVAAIVVIVVSRRLPVSLATQQKPDTGTVAAAG